MKKAYSYDGITIQQNNEPAGGQHAFHYHLHIFPRYENDEFYKNILLKIKTTTDRMITTGVKPFWLGSFI